jgi:integrase
MNGGEDPEITKWIKPRTGEKKKLPEELLTESDIKRMILAAEHLRDKALVAVLYDSGARISEIGNLRLKHVVFDKYGAVLTVDGKTGMRRVRVIFSAPYLASWIDMHPGKKNPESFLWINVGQRNRGAHMRYPGFCVLIKRIAKNAGIEKRVYNHLFRHSRSTELSQHLTEAQMEEHLGWIHGSKMPRTYIHMSGRQMDDAILKIHGIVKKEDLKPELTSVTCSRCEHVNGPTSDFCCKCGMTLTIQAATDVEKKRSNIAMALMELVEKDPEVAKVLRGVI